MHIARVFRKAKSNPPKTPRPNIKSIDLTTKNHSVNAIANIKYEPVCKFDYDSSDDNIVASIAITTLQVEPKETTLQIGNKNVDFLSDSGIFCSILNDSLATGSRWLTTAPTNGLKNFANEPIHVIGVMQTPGASNCRRINDSEFATDHDRLKPPLSRDWFKALGVSLTHTLNPLRVVWSIISLHHSNQTSNL